MEPFELTSTEGGGIKLALVPVLDMRVAPAFKAAFEAALEKNQPLAIDASAVEYIATPCIQIVLAAAKALEEAGQPFHFVSPTEEFVTAFSDLGLFATLLTWKIEEAA